MAINRIVRGADLKCYINGNLIGEFTDLSYSIDYGRRPIYGIDSTMPFELIPGPTKVSGSINMLRIRASAGLEGRGIAARLKEILQEKYINITVIDKVLDLEILKVQRANITSQRWSVSSKGRLSGSFTFEGLDVDNEYGNVYG